MSRTLVSLHEEERRQRQQVPGGPDASLTHHLPSMRGLLRRASGDSGEFTDPRGRSYVCYSKVKASSMAGMCENAIMSSEFQFSVLMMG